MIFRRRQRTEEGVPPTPLVDVMFNLLIFVLVTAQYTNVQALKVRLPQAETGASLEKLEKVVITVTKEEQVFLEGKAIDPAALEASLKPLGRKEPQPSVFIQADEGSTTGRLVTVMDVASKAGLKKISIETRK